MIQAGDLPAAALLARYRDYTPAGAAGAQAYTDCFCADLARTVTLAEYVDAFYRGPVIRIERALIGVLLGRRSTAADIAALAQGSASTFSAWKVEDRAPDQLLLCDYAGSTRSWLMCTPTAEGTRLYFGSAVVPFVDRKTGQARMGALFKPLMGFHKVYSRHLLRAAHARLARV